MHGRVFKFEKKKVVGKYVCCLFVFLSSLHSHATVCVCKANTEENGVMTFFLWPSNQRMRDVLENILFSFYYITHKVGGGLHSGAVISTVAFQEEGPAGLLSFCLTSFPCASVRRR